jgi:hypothetical protein
MNAQKEYKAYVIQDMGSEQTPVTIYLNDNAYRLTKKDILDIFIYIKAIAGDNIITAKLEDKTGDSHAKFVITVTDLVNQEHIKTIRATNKGTQLSKADVAGKVWKYRYIPPALESNYFERNVGDNKETTKIKQLKQTYLFKRNAFGEQIPSNWVRPGVT